MPSSMNWVDGAAGGTPVSAANLNKLAVVADVGTAGTPTGDALRAAFVPKWKPSTAYASGEFVLNPSGQIVSANTAFTSGASYSGTNWTVVAGGGAVSSVVGASGAVTGTQIAADPAVLGAFALSLNPLNYGAVGNGATDDTTALNAALAAAKTRGVAVVDGGGRTYKVTARLTVDSVTLRNCNLALSGVTANVRLTGTSPALRNAVVAADTTVPTDTWGSDGGMINLHTSVKATIDNVECTAATARRAVQCITTANYTVINNLRTYTAWGILFNDTSFITRTSIEGVDYSALSIGTGLSVTNSDFFGPSNAAWTGDAIEINVPAQRFSNVMVSKSRVHQTYTSSGVGIGFGFANVDHVTVDNCYAENVPSPAAAYHAEHCTDVKFTNNTAKNCRQGADISFTRTAKIIGNTFDSCWEFSFKSQTDTSAFGSEPNVDLSLIDNTFIGLATANGVTALNDVVIGNTSFVVVRGNKFLGMGMTGLTHIQFLAYGPTPIGVTHGEVTDNVFASVPGFAASDLIFVDPTTTGLRSSGNDFGEYTGPAAVFCHRIALHGICQDFYRTGVATSAANGMDMKTAATPQGFVTGAAGRLATDVVNGVRYKYDTGSSTWLPDNSPVDVQVFSTPGTATWTKPAGAKSCQVTVISGGGGGGSGRQGAAGTVRCGGGGGASGAMSAVLLRASDLTATVTVTVGAGGNGGAAVSAADTNGNNGTAGGLSTFGNYCRTVGGGAAGSGGTSAAGAAGAGSVFLGGLGASLAGGAASGTGGAGTASGGTGSQGTGNPQYMGTGGGGGGGVTSADVANGGGPAGVVGFTSNNGGLGGAVGGASPTTVAAPSPTTPAPGGGGGAASITAAAQAGATGGGPGGGGGGGGASLDGNTSGAGGAGGAGAVVVVTYF